MPFTSVSNSFREGIKLDINIFDNLESITILHNSDTPTLDFTSGVAQRSVVSIDVPNCLFRQPSNRNGPSIPQLNERAMGIQKDDFSKVDVVIEIPKLDNISVTGGDEILRISDGSKWRVVMLDTATLSTRTRLGCSRFT